MNTPVFTSALLICISFLLSGTFTSLAEAQSDSAFNTTHSSSSEILQAVKIAQASMSGSIVRAEKKFARERTYWRVDVITSSGAAVEIQIDLEEHRIIAVKAEEGPFDYGFEPGSGLTGLEAAKSKAESEAGSPVLKWKLVESAKGMQYHFWLFTKGGPAQYKLDAVSGERIVSKKRIKKR